MLGVADHVAFGKMKKRLLLLGLCGLLAAGFAFIDGVHLVAPPVSKAKQAIAEGTKQEPLSEGQSRVIEKALADFDTTVVWEKAVLDRSRLIAIASLFAVSVGCLFLRQGECEDPKKNRPNQPLQGTPAKAPSSSTEPEGRRS